MKILESRAKSFYKLKNVKLLKRYVTGQREAEILNKKTQKKNKNKHRDFSQEKKQMERKKMILFGFWRLQKSGTIVRLDTRFPLSIFVTVAL